MSDIAAAQRLPLRAAAFSSVLEQLNPTDGETVYLHAQRLGQAGKWDDALAPLLRLRESNPENANIANSLGAAYYQTFDYEKSDKCLHCCGDSGPEERGLRREFEEGLGGRCGGRGPRRAHERARGEDRVEEGRSYCLRSLLEKYPY